MNAGLPQLSPCWQKLKNGEHKNNYFQQKKACFYAGFSNCFERKKAALPFPALSLSRGIDDPVRLGNGKPHLFRDRSARASFSVKRDDRSVALRVFCVARHDPVLFPKLMNRLSRDTELLSYRLIGLHGFLQSDQFTLTDSGHRLTPLRLIV
jgi:hypothetical protein